MNDLLTQAPPPGTENTFLPNDFGDPAQPNPFHPLPSNDREPSDLDDNPRYLRLQNFRSRFLTGRRDITVYLPEAYLTDSARHFPVFYLHDGQNLIDPRTSFVPGRTWRVDSTADALAASHEAGSVILVGIANTGVRRMAEYTPTRDPRRGGGDGPRYGRLLVQELKPVIDMHFRTLPGPEDTAIGGSSLGGLISLALALDYPEVFGKAAVMSPSVWWNQRAILNRVSGARPKPSLRLWLDMGTGEGLRHVRDTDLLHRRLLQRGWEEAPGPDRDLLYLHVPGALHDEAAWAARFDQVLRFLFPYPG